MYNIASEERYEFWNGEMVVMDPSGPEHECLSAGLTSRVHAYVSGRKLGKTFGSNTAVYLHGELTNCEFVMPDLSFIRTEWLGLVVPQRGIYGAPDLAVEGTITNCVPNQWKIDVM